MGIPRSPVYLREIGLKSLLRQRTPFATVIGQTDPEVSRLRPALL